ncbi:MAG: hypothetical protein IT175_13270 [Acidobacteria bacterium]|nr:hypothetical protein [Acidobacteriota bacterium]
MSSTLPKIEVETDYLDDAAKAPTRRGCGHRLRGGIYAEVDSKSDDWQQQTQEARELVLSLREKVSVTVHLGGIGDFPLTASRRTEPGFEYYTVQPRLCGDSERRCEGLLGSQRLGDVSEGRRRILRPRRVYGLRNLRTLNPRPT